MSTSQALLKNYDGQFKRAAQHKLIRELCAGTLSDRALYTYVAQDLLFIQNGLRAICKLAALAPDEQSLMTLTKRLGFFANLDYSYFYNCIELLGPTLSTDDAIRLKTKRLPLVDKYMEMLEKEIQEEKSYGKMASLVYCMEVVYLEWTKCNPVGKNMHWKYQTWVDLHAGDDVDDWCDFLAKEVDKYSYDEVAPIFGEVLEYEYDFFDSCYNS